MQFGLRPNRVKRDHRKSRPSSMKAASRLFTWYHVCTTSHRSAAAADIVNFAVERLLASRRTYGIVWSVSLARLLMRRELRVSVVPMQVARADCILCKDRRSPQQRQSQHSGNEFLHISVPI